jgi:ABC-type transport system substrate-binding protein
MYGVCSYYYLSTAAYNISGYNNPRVDSLFKDALARDEAGYNESMHEVSKIIAGDGPWVVWGRQDTVDVISKKFTGLEPDASGDGFGGWRLQNIALA